MDIIETKKVIQKTSNVCVRESKGKGRGVFAVRNIPGKSCIEVCPILVLSPKDRKWIEKTKLYNYDFEWGRDKKKAAIALGCGSLYNHSDDPNAEWIGDAKTGTMTFYSLRAIKKDEEITFNYNGYGSKEPVWFKTKSKSKIK